MPSKLAPSSKKAKSAKSTKRASLTRSDDVADEPPGGGISVVTYGPSPTPSGGTSFPTDNFLEGERTGWFARRTTISPETLQANLKRFLGSMTTAMEGIPSVLAGFELNEIELSLEIGAEGEIGLLGTGGKVSGTGSISLTLKRPTAGKD